MKIEKLVIYGFGKHDNLIIELDPGINVLYGHNESGKTTIQQFILHVLFGFPSRNSTRLRYEPKSGGRYGGQIHLHDPVYGKCIVERVRGKSAGDVKVYFENGEVGEQEALNKLLRQYDRASFESIFSFSLLQLQGFEKMNEQELSRTLLASGTTGVDHLLQVEASMEKEMDGLFKKSGRNPELNKKLTELRKLEDALQEEVRKSDQYAPAVERLKEVEGQLGTIHLEKEAYEKNLRTLAIERQQLPLQQKRAVLQERLITLADTHFPADGIQRYESIVRQLDEVQATTVRIQEEVKQVEHLLDERADQEKLLTLEQFIERESEWHRSLSALASLKMDREQLIEQENQLRVRLGIQMDEEGTELLTADVSIRKEEELYELLESLKDFHREIDIIERKQAELQEEIARMEERKQYVTKPSEKDMQQAEQWPKIRQQLAEAKAYVMIHDQQENNFKTILFSLLAFMLLIAGYGILSKQYGILFIAVLGAFAAFVWSKRQKTNEQVKKAKQLLTHYEGQESEMEAVFERVRLYDEEKENHEERHGNIEMDSRNLATSAREIEEKIHQTEWSLQSFLAQYGIDGLPSATIIPELFRMIRALQEVMRQLGHTEERYQQLSIDIQQKHEEVEQALQQAVPKEALYEWVRKEYKIMTTKARQQQTAIEKKQQLEKELKEKEALTTLLQEQIERLFKETAVETEEAYYHAHQIEQEKLRIDRQLEELAAQLIGQPAIDLSLTDEQFENMMEEIKESMATLNQQQKVLVEEKAILLNQTNALLSDEASSQLQQQFEMARAQFIALAKKWAAKKALASAIQQMMNDLKEKKFPAVLKEAERLFNRLTNGRYDAMIMTEEGYFEVVSKSGMRFPIIELSQATKEQAYISLRLALAASIVETAPFPIMMDDPFVHFDEQRLSHMSHIIDGFTTHQFIYFTCQESMKNNWHEATTIKVSTIRNNQGANV